MLCTGLWIACADTPPPLCAAWGWRCGYSSSVHRENASACGYAVHGLCAGKTFGPGGRPQWSEVIHIRNFTYDVTCAVLRSRSERSPGQPAQHSSMYQRASSMRHPYIDSLGSPRSGQQGPSRGRRRLGVGSGGMRAFAGRALARFSSIRACVRRTGDSSAGSAGLSTSLLAARPAQMMRQPGDRLPLLARATLVRREPRAGPERQTEPGRRPTPDGTTVTSPGWPRSGKWSPTPIPNSRSACPATYPLPNNRLRATLRPPTAPARRPHVG